MRYFLLYIVAFLILTTSIFGQTNKVLKDTPQITARVENIFRQNKKDWVIFEVNLLFELKNTLKRKLFILDNEFSLYGVEVYRNSGDSENLESILRNQTPPSFSGNIKWVNVGEEIISSGTKSNFLTSLNPDESRYIQKKYTFGFPSEKYKNFSKSPSWQEVQNARILFLKFDINIWENEIRTKDVSSKEFPKELTPKIEKEGVFWFNSLKSNLIPVDLSSAAVKIDF